MGPFRQRRRRQRHHHPGTLPARAWLVCWHGGGLRHFISLLLARRSPLLSHDRRPRVRRARWRASRTGVLRFRAAVRCPPSLRHRHHPHRHSHRHRHRWRQQRWRPDEILLPGRAMHSGFCSGFRGEFGALLFCASWLAVGCGLGNLRAPVQNFRVALAKDSGMANGGAFLLLFVTFTTIYNCIIYLLC